MDQASFMASSVLQSWRFPKFDVLLASSPPLFVAMAGYMISRVWRRPWIFELRDLWPASIEAVGLGNKTPMRILEKVELFLYRKADRIISLTDAFKDNLTKRGIAPDKIDIVTNGVDTDMFNPQNAKEDGRKTLGIERDDFLVAYFGTTGMAHGLETMLEAAQLCRENSRIKFLIMGDGAERKALELKSREMGNSNVLFRDSVPHEEMPDYFAALDMFLVHLKPHPVFKTVIPSKIFEAMAMGTPILCALEGEGARVVSESGAGVCIPPGNATVMAETISRLSNQPDELKQMGKAGRKAAIEKFSRRLKAEECLRSFEKVLAAGCHLE
jgi:glycosyltransferase involved in cell wall biosynthesis